MVETLQVQQIMVGQLIKKYFLLLPPWSSIYYANLKRYHECKYCNTDLQ